MEKSKVRYSILLSAALQLTLGAFTAHPYDGRVFLTAGYLVAHGQSPYVPADVSGVFGKELFPSPVPGIGYPPPWSLVLAIDYLLSYNLFPSLVFYNIAMKVPIVAVNILLALLVGRMVVFETPDSVLSNDATQFMLFNPYVIYTTAIWGQFDTASTLPMLLSILMFIRGRQRLSAVALGSAIALKVLPIALLPLLILYEKRRAGWLSALRYSGFAAAVVGAAFTPFLLGWNVQPIIENWNVHFVRIGAFSPMQLLLSFGMNAATGGLQVLGYLWVPALAVVYFFLLRKRNSKPSGLIVSALVIMLALSLSRSWVSEQNLNFVLPLVLLASIDQAWSRKWVTATWMLPLIFALLHTAPLKMLFLVTPEPHIGPATFEQLLNNLASVGQILIVLTWLVVGAALLKKSIEGSRLSGEKN